MFICKSPSYFGPFFVVDAFEVGCLTFVKTRYQSQLGLGEPSKQKIEKIWDNVQIRVDPPPSDLWDIFEFGTFLKNVDPPPSDQIGTFLNFRHFL